MHVPMLYQVLLAMRCTREVLERANTTNTTAADIWLRVRIGFHTSPPHARKETHTSAHEIIQVYILAILMFIDAKYM